MLSPTKYTLEFSEEAKDDIDQINLYTLTTWGEQQLAVYASLLDEAFCEIAENPEIGRRREGLPKQFKGYKVGKHVVFYLVRDNTVFVVRVLHSSMDFANHL